MASGDFNSITAFWHLPAKDTRRYGTGMRIVGGTFRGHSIHSPASASIRPTADRVRESIFNILAHGTARIAIGKARVMDLFAGTGAMGFEALSRGARFCQFVEESAEARGLIRRNADALGVIGVTKIWRRDASRLGPCAPQSPFNLVFADPPYGRGLGEKALSSLVDGTWLAPGAVVVLEEAAQAPLGEVPVLKLVDRRDYGDTQVRFYRFPESGPAEEPLQV